MKRSRCPCVAAKPAASTFGVVVDVHRRGDSVFAQRLLDQLLHVDAFELAEIGRLLDEAVLDDSGHSDSDRIHAASRPRRLRISRARHSAIPAGGVLNSGSASGPLR